MNERGPAARRLWNLAARSLAAALVVLAVSAGGMSAASAVGDATLQGYILTDPIPGWGTAPSQEVQALQTDLSNALTHEGSVQVATALQAWTGPQVGTDLIIFLARYPNDAIPPVSELSGDAENFCTGAGAGVASGGTSTVSGIPNSMTETCSNSPPTRAALWEQGDILVFVGGAGVSSSTLDSISRTQAAQVPGSGSSSADVGLYAGIAAAAVVIAIIVVVLVRRRSAAQAAPAAVGDFFGAGAPPQWGWGPRQPPYGAPGGPGGDGGAGPYGGGGPYAPPGQYTGPAPYAQPRPYVEDRPDTPAGQYGQPISGSMSGGEDGTATVGAWQPAQETPADDRHGQPNAAAGAEAQPAEPTPASQDVPPERTAPVEQTTRPAEPSPASQDVPPEQTAQPAGTRREVGWHAIDGDVNHQRYWDGSSWTARMRWDGSSWVNETE